MEPCEKYEKAMEMIGVLAEIYPFDMSKDTRGVRNRCSFPPKQFNFVVSAALSLRWPHWLATRRNWDT